ncbi:LysR family transcriptional regulator, glycine cleavage system transcriptional activator [Pseudomonas sp. ok272]|uniref:LysR substrate-binding domain-containing protein n=1 Tax=unclassified Pseudomonas TaxID=196821 RepID=UPI0008AB81DF|nr:MULTISPECIES: LysR substrate-binding domain-containing protein [unclassified Pseudomonas]SEN11346.1 LysR family transcriptional regulator, glycine cleavage system transcriptional activator [Pseudomonas sp. ok272]SFN04424.1 LysR family transcriptional regulator, glycine cleavage system transcriptional activator [Pseudomonas sp. ok602]
MNKFTEPFALTRLPHMTLLLAFKTVAEQGSFTRAATVLHLSQSAVSQQVVKLEEALGVVLFARSTRTVTLTKAGAGLLQDIGAPFEQLLSAFEKCARQTAPPVLHIEAEPVMSAFWLTPRLKHFTQRFPALRIQQLLSTQRVEFPDGVELAIKWGTAEWPGFDAEFLMGLNYAPMCSPSLLDGLRVPADLAHQALLHDRHYHDWESWQALYPTPGLEVRSGHVVTDSNVLAQLAIEGHGVALCAIELTERAVRNGELVLPFPDMLMPHPLAYYLLTQPQRGVSEMTRQFIAWLREEAAALSS